MSSSDREDLLRLLEEAISQTGGVRALARLIGWDIGSMGKVRAGKERISPYRAAQVAEVLEIDPRLGAFLALKAGAKSDSEREFWDALFQHDLMWFDLLNLSRTVRHAEMKANTAGADAEQFKKMAKEAREAIAEAVAAGAKLPPAMEGKF